MNKQDQYDLPQIKTLQTENSVCSDRKEVIKSVIFNI